MTERIDSRRLATLQQRKDKKKTKTVFDLPNLSPIIKNSNILTGVESVRVIAIFLVSLKFWICVLNANVLIGRSPSGMKSLFCLPLPNALGCQDSLTNRKAKNSVASLRGSSADIITEPQAYYRWNSESLRQTMTRRISVNGLSSGQRVWRHKSGLHKENYYGISVKLVRNHHTKKVGHRRKTKQRIETGYERKCATGRI